VTLGKERTMQDIKEKGGLAAAIERDFSRFKGKFWEGGDRGGWVRGKKRGEMRGELL